MKLEELREALKREPNKKRAKPAKPLWQVCHVIRQRPLSLQRQRCACGRKRHLLSRKGYLVELTCRACGILWRVSPHACRDCGERPVSDYNRVCGECMARIFPPMHHRCRST